MEKYRPQPPTSIRFFFYGVLFFLFIPIFVLVIGSLFDQEKLSLRWYEEILHDEELMSALGRSLILAVSSSLIATLLGLCSALAIYKSGFIGKKIIQTFSVIAMVLPELVFALSLLSWFVLIQFQLSLMTVILAHVTFSLSFSLFLISSRFTQMDPSLDDAARDLGASEWRIIGTITLPSLAPAMIGSLVLCFLLSFDDFLISYFVSGVGADTLPIRLYTGMKAGHTPKLNALSTLMMIMSLSSLYLLFSSKNVRKMLSGTRP